MGPYHGSLTRGRPALALAVLVTGCAGAATPATGLPPVEPERPAARVQVKPAPGAPTTGKGGITWLRSKPAGVSFTRSEVTVAQFRVCSDAGACKGASYTDKTYNRDCNRGHPGRKRHPMNCATWQGAVEFCAWAGGRLPTEKEWYAEASNGGTRKHP